MAVKQEEGQKEDKALGLADFTEEEIGKFYELAANRLNDAMAKTLDKSKGDAPVYVLLSQKGSPFANYLGEIDSQLYTLMINRSQAMEVKAKQMQEMLAVYQEKNLADIGFRNKKKTFFERLRPAPLLGAFMGGVMGLFLGQQFANNLDFFKDKTPSENTEEAKDRTLPVKPKHLLVAVATALTAVLGFIGVEKIPLLSQKKKEALHEEAAKLPLNELNQRIRELNGEIRNDHEGLLDEVKKAAMKADVLRMMKEVVANRAKEQEKAVQSQADNYADKTHTQMNEDLKRLHKEGEDVVKTAAKSMGVAPRMKDEPRSISPEAVREQQQDPNRGRTMAGA